MNPSDLWVLIPIVAIVSGVVSRIAKTWIKIKAQQQTLGASSRELERDVAELRQDRASLLQRLENLEAIVVSQTWDAIHDHSLPPQDRDRRIASAVHREVAPSAPSSQQRAQELAGRLRG